VHEPLYDIFVHPEKDPGCLLKAHDFLRAFSSSYSHALVMFDRQGCGRDERSRDELEKMVEDHLRQSGWAGRSTAIAIDPELENWVWTGSHHVDAVLGWKGRSTGLRDWLISEGFLGAQEVKPARPKQAVEKALWLARKPRSSSLYLQLAKRVSLSGCTDGAFRKLQKTLSNWFPHFTAAGSE
jgi:hypothetical protein